MISIISLLTHGHADVLWLNGRKSSIGISICAEAISGFGKSLSLHIFMNSIEQHLKKWAEIDEKYLDFLIEDVTREAVVASLARFPVAALVTDEVGQIKNLFSHAPTLVKLLDGTSVRNARVGTGRKAVIDPRFLMLLMTQPDVFKQIKDKFVSVGGVGLGNRFFFVSCNNLVASDSLHKLSLSQSLEAAYEEKVATLLSATFAQIERIESSRPTLKLSAHASEFFVSLIEDGRKKCQSDGAWASISEYGIRHAERVLRLAGALHVFEYGAQGEVSLETMTCAAALGIWYMEEFAKMFYEPPKQSQLQLDVTTLENALRHSFQLRNIWMCAQSELRLVAPNLGLTPARLNRALAALCIQGNFQIVIRAGKPWVALKRAYLCI